jgi:hypothetical protein
MAKWKKCVLILAVFAALFLGGALMYQSRFATVGENRYEKDITSIDLSGAPVGDLSQLESFPGLKQIDLRDSGLTCRQYDGLKEKFPDAEILWDIPFQGEYLDMNTRELSLKTLAEEDLEVISYFTRLQTVSAEGCSDYAALHALRQQYPDLDVRYQIVLAGASYDHGVTDLVLPGESTDEMIAMLPYFTQLKTVELTEPLAPIDQIRVLMETLPEVAFSWNLELGGISVDESTETLDLTGITMTVEEMDAVLPYLLNLTYVDMTDCGISNEEMDALNRRYENTKIVWTVDIGRVMRVKTDETWFMPGKWYYKVGTRDVYNLRYCTDMICVDIGHMPVDNCEWARYMPKLKYFLICDTNIRDISPIAGLQELVYVEIFTNDIFDYSPLLECPALEDLNLHFTFGDPNIIKQLTWVNNIWWRNIYLTEEERQMLRDALPNVHFEFWSVDATGAGWRQLKNYYDQRDLMGVPYMD